MLLKRAHLLIRKSCDLIVLNGPDAMNADTNRVEIIDKRGKVVRTSEGPKQLVAEDILAVIQSTLVVRSGSFGA